ncbi:MAG: type II-A CRISPR-associated protein Csn2 [Veillonella caviae]|nr:type II-A CRISPR-associated protein Csn2 [Veillonella caviae]
MKLTNTGLDITVELSKENVTTLVIEDALIYRNIINELIKSIEGHFSSWSLSEHGVEYVWKKDVYMITDFFSLDFSNRTLLTKLHQRLTLIAQENMGDLFEINNKIQQLLLIIEDAVPLNLVHNENISAVDLIKMAAVKIDGSAFDLIEQTISFVDVVMELLHPKLVILLNVRSIMSAEEVTLFFETLLSKKIPVLCIEKNRAELVEIVKFTEIVYTVDSEYCIF